MSRRRFYSYISPSGKGNHPHLASPFESTVIKLRNVIVRSGRRSNLGCGNRKRCHRIATLGMRERTLHQTLMCNTTDAFNHTFSPPPRLPRFARNDIWIASLATVFGLNLMTLPFEGERFERTRLLRNAAL